MVTVGQPQSTISTIGVVRIYDQLDHVGQLHIANSTRKALPVTVRVLADRHWATCLRVVQHSYSISR